MQGCNSATKKQAIRRAVERRVQETADILIDIDLEGELRSSQYFLEVRERFRRQPGKFFPQVRGLLIMLMAIPNGSRAGEFVVLRVCILSFHTFNQFIHSLINHKMCIK
ncbi:hypothetical protein DPMN_135193 [Dreissena polymorpha]|uniref:Uncharacterized protein n=1 Tax=Dreissena polymorpha TaxID=45954 RepID=A0A9D4G1F3_DREPO|nr:hypothetical protein DPMN_135193 [Dreissena polymorpha]